jgi:DNA-binding winged helix-turn-helix (wHTH) protein
MEQRSAAGRWVFPRFLQDRGAVKVQFAEFTLDTEARRLIRQGVEVHLSSKAFDLLWLLIERRPNVLDKSSLHARLWPRTFVVDANLSVLVAELRRALADNAREPRFIRTVHAHGYAFCGEAADLDPPAPEPAANGARCWLMWNERAIVLREGASVIGRDPECPVWLDASGVSRSHARIDVERGGAVVRIEDLGSKNGTFVDGAPVRGIVLVSDGSEIQVGSVTLTVRVWSRGKVAETERIARRDDSRE